MLVAACLMGAFLATSCCNCDKGKDACCKEKMECPQGPEGPKPGCCKEGRPEGPMCGGEGRCEMSEEQKAQCEKWMKFDSLSVDEQKALIKERKAEIDQREAEMAAKKAEFEAKWANFDNLSIEEQKQLIDMKSCPKKMGCKKGGCHKGGPRPDGPKPEGPKPDCCKK